MSPRPLNQRTEPLAIGPTERNILLSRGLIKQTNCEPIFIGIAIALICASSLAAHAASGPCFHPVMRDQDGKV
jgi:hypothetical protein